MARSGILDQVVDSIAGTIVAALVLVWLGISWGLSPLSRIEAALARRSSADLRPLVHHVPAEVEPLVVGVNKLMERLNSALSATRTFTGNASHQLRIPSAVAKANLELAASQDNGQERDKLIESALGAMTRHHLKITSRNLVRAAAASCASSKSSKQVTYLTMSQCRKGSTAHDDSRPPRQCNHQAARALQQLLAAGSIRSRQQ